MKEALQHAVLTLRQQGLSTPEICQQLALDSDVVINVLLSGALIPEQSTTTALNRSVGRPQKLEEHNLLASIAKAIVGKKNEPNFLWTFPDLLQAVRNTLRSNISQDTLRRCLTKQGLTFANQLKQVVGESVPPSEIAAFSNGAILYVISHQKLYQPDEGEPSRLATTLITGVTAFNRLAMMARPQSRLSPGMLVAFLRGLLALHPTRHIAVILSARGVYRSVVRERSLNQDPRFRIYLAKK